MQRVCSYLFIISVLHACVPDSTLERNHADAANSDTASSRQLVLQSLGGDLVALTYQSSRGMDPRVLEIWIQCTNVQSVRGYTAGAALDAAGKALSVQAKGNGLFRLIALSSENTIGIRSGELAQLEFERASEGLIRAEILTDRPMFAPQEAQAGLVVGDPIEF
jgi:hypothetical protein